MMQKKLTFDVVFVNGNETIFELRFQKLYQDVDYFLIFGSEFNLKKIEKYYDTKDSKIKTFSVEETFSEGLKNEEVISTLILDTIKELYSSFEDMIFFSFSNEIPNISSLNEIDIKSKEVNFLMCDVYEGNFERKRRHLELGPILINFSHMLKNKTEFLNQILNFKLNSKFQDIGVYNGFKILNYTKGVDNLPNHYVCPFSGKFIEYKFSRANRKFVFLCDVNVDNSEFDYLFNIKFIKKFPEEYFIDLNNRIQNLEIYIPQTHLYFTNLSDFQTKYKISEISKILSVFDCTDNDDVEIYYEDGSVKKLKFHEIENPSF
jgi:hypothetical protein